MPHELTIVEVVERAATGDPAACQLIFKHWHDAVLGYCTAFATGDDQLATSLTVESWVEIFANLHRLEDPRRISEWLHSTTRVTCIRVVERQHRRGHAPSRLPEPIFELVTTCPKRDLQEVAAIVHDDKPGSAGQAARRLGIGEAEARNRLRRFNSWARVQLVMRIARRTGGAA